jgi:hypothetical protein
VSGQPRIIMEMSNRGAHGVGVGKVLAGPATSVIEPGTDGDRVGRERGGDQRDHDATSAAYGPVKRPVV